ncbi:MAG: hypothetical protein PHV17_01000 [Candidatus Omnitrophica bacterium]|nr:hypothetical protein [Candidatus Omnitrophota bacterium]
MKKGKIRIKYLAVLIVTAAFVAIFFLGAQSFKGTSTEELITGLPKSADYPEGESSDVISEIHFYGAAKDEAKKMEENGLFIPVDSFSWSYALVRFKNKVNLWDHCIVFSAKGVYGNEVLKVGVIDANRHTTAADKSYQVDLSTEWKKITIKAEDIKTLFVNKNCVIDLKLTADVVSKVSHDKGMIYIKDISLIKRDVVFDVPH